MLENADKAHSHLPTGHPWLEIQQDFRENGQSLDCRHQLITRFVRSFKIKNKNKSSYSIIFPVSIISPSLNHTTYLSFLGYNFVEWSKGLKSTMDVGLRKGLDGKVTQRSWVEYLNCTWFIRSQMSWSNHTWRKGRVSDLGELGFKHHF